MHPREAIQAWNEGRLDGTGLARALVSWGDWLVPARIGPEGPQPAVRHDGEERWFPACSDREALEVLGRALGVAPEHWLALDGVPLFVNLDPALSGVDVDPYSPHAVHWKRDQLRSLTEMARAVEVERVLAAVEVPDAFRKLREYEGWSVILRVGPAGGSELVLAPDRQDRRLAAVFTAPDTLRAFQEDRAVELGSAHVVVPMRGSDLFAWLADQELDGIAFDCAGPIPARAVRIDFARVVLEPAREAE
jgi:hypothetical protein